MGCSDTTVLYVFQLHILFTENLSRHAVVANIKTKPLKMQFQYIILL